MLVPERGLENTRRNRRWLALVKLLAEHGGSQEQNEELAWRILAILESVK